MIAYDSTPALDIEAWTTTCGEEGENRTWLTRDEAEEHNWYAPSPPKKHQTEKCRILKWLPPLRLVGSGEHLQ